MYAKYIRLPLALNYNIVLYTTLNELCALSNLHNPDRDCNYFHDFHVRAVSNFQCKYRPLSGWKSR